MNRSDGALSPRSTGIPFGRYVVHRLLGMGGMAEIYQASVSGPGGFEKPVVIKRVRSQYAQNETFVQMFTDEARICASLNHANLVTVFDFGQEDGHFYMAMELVDGLDLRTAHVRHAQLFGKPLPWEVSAVVMRDALRGLHYAHTLLGPDGNPLGIVHRDIDLANIMVRRDGAVKVLDFGCAKASSAIRRTQTVVGVIKGKLGYMSPEQSEDRPLDGRSDVFAASIVLHELLTGRRLFFGDDPLSVIQSVRSRPIPDPREKNPTVPQELARIVLRGLARPLPERYQSAAAMADDLDGLVHEHRLGSDRVAQVFAPLLQDSPASMEAEITQDQRRLTLAAWSESTGDAEPLEIISGILLEEDGASTADAPFIDATIVVTNPRWMLPEEMDTQTDIRPAGAAASGESPPTGSQGEAPALDLHGEQTQLLTDASLGDASAKAFPPVSHAHTEGEGPAIALADQQTAIISLDQRGAFGDGTSGPLGPSADPTSIPNVAAPPHSPPPAATAQGAHGSFPGGMRTQLILAGLALAAGVITVWLLLR